VHCEKREKRAREFQYGPTMIQWASNLDSLALGQAYTALEETGLSPIKDSTDADVQLYKYRQ